MEKESRSDDNTCLQTLPNAKIMIGYLVAICSMHWAASIQHIQLIYDILCIIYIILIRIANDIYENKEDKTNDTFTMSIEWKYQDIKIWQN